MKIAIITGASSGMGRDFARQIAASEPLDEMWLIARRREKLEQLAAELPVACKILPLDLADSASIAELQRLLEAERPEVAYLVNASGFGRFALSTDVEPEVYAEMIDVNTKALTAMCFAVLPYMQRGSSIINIGSLSAFQPVPYINVYGATKAYVLSFSRALNAELRPRGIRVICVCPGWVKTEFFDHAVSSNNAVTYYNKYWESADVVRKALRDLRRGKDVSVLGFGVRAQVLLTKLLPHRIVMNIWLKQQGHK